MFQDLKNALINIKTILDPDGLIYIETPDAMNYKNFITSPFQEFNHEHIEFVP